MFRQDLENSGLMTFWITDELNYGLKQVQVVIDLLVFHIVMRQPIPAIPILLSTHTHYLRH